MPPINFGENHSTEAPSVAFKTLGCRLNKAEEADFAARFLAAGFRIAGNDETPNVIVLHSCAVTRAAERDTFRQIRSRRTDASISRTLIVVTGCAVECNGQQLFLDAGADIIIPRNDQQRIAEIVLAHIRQRECAKPALSTFSPFCELQPYFTTKRALLKVQDGCNFKCAYCIVPTTRGSAISRPWHETISAAEALLERNFREIVLTGCNLACYDADGHTLAELTACVCDIAARYGARIRLGSVEPGICDESLCEVMQSHPNLCRFFHFPIQSGDGMVLKAMGRRYTAEYISDLLHGIKDQFPLISLNADLITGLPGEDEAAFQRTCELVRETEFAHVHVFPYSPRQGTAAPNFADCPSRTVAKERAARLRSVADEAGTAYRKRLVGRETEMLIEGFTKDGLAYGWNDGHIQCRCKNPAAQIATLCKFTPSRLSENGTLL